MYVCTHEGPVGCARVQGNIREAQYIDARYKASIKYIITYADLKRAIHNLAHETRQRTPSEAGALRSD